MEFAHMLGTVLLVYGIFKFIVGISGLTLPRETLVRMKKLPVIGSFISTDVTTAGKAIEISIVCFALYSIGRGIYLLKFYDHASFKSMMESRNVTFVLYGVMGLFLTLFYSLVVYTSFDLKSMSITMDAKEKGTYKLIGLGTGLMYLFILMCMTIYHANIPITSKQFKVMVVIFSIIASLLIFVIMDSYEKIRQKQGEILTMIMIPLGSA